jgi:hypothetical protein
LTYIRADAKADLSCAIGMLLRDFKEGFSIPSNYFGIHCADAWV